MGTYCLLGCRAGLPRTAVTVFRLPRGTPLATRATMMVQRTSVRTSLGAIPSISCGDGFSDDMAVSGAARAAVSFTVSSLRFQGNMVQDPVHMSAQARHPELSMCPSVASTGAQVEGRIFWGLVHRHRSRESCPQGRGPRTWVHSCDGIWKDTSHLHHVRPSLPPSHHHHPPTHPPTHTHTPAQPRAP